MLAQQEVIGIITLAIGDIKTSENRILTSGDPVYFNETIIASENSKSQIVLLDETVMMIGAGTELTIDEFIYNPENLNGKITTNIKQGSIKILSGKISETNPEDLIAFVVNKALDGDDEPINAITDKPTRGKAKAMMVKIKRGSVDRPAMPEVSAAPEAAPAVETPTSSGEESEEDLIARLVEAGVNGNMGEINALDDRVIRGKIKAAIVKAKRAKG